MKKIIIHPRYDSIYRSVFLLKFLNRLMWGGKRTLIEKIIYGLFKDLNFIGIFYKKNIFKTNCLPIFLFFEVISICRPLLGALVHKKTQNKRNKSRGKKDIAINTKIIPITISRKKSYFIAIGWFISSIKLRRENKLKNKVIGELSDIFIFKNSVTLQKKTQLYALLVTNRSNSHYRWN